MKTLFIAFTLITSLLNFHEKTDTIKVGGNCGMCKARIEKALKINGINKANWEVKTKMLTVTYDTQVISFDQIQQAVANAGHDTEKIKAVDSVYTKLPGCCKYEREKLTILNNN